MAAAAAAAKPKHRINVTTEFAGTDNVVEDELERLLKCPDLQTAVNEVKSSVISELTVTASFKKLDTRYIIVFTYATPPDEEHQDYIKIDIYGPSRKTGAVISCSISQSTKWELLTVDSFVLDVGAAPKANFKQDKAWPGWGPRGFLVSSSRRCGLGWQFVQLADL